MSECAFCDNGVQPFYDLDSKDGSKQSICHTCFHLGKHKAPRPTEPGATKSQPGASSTATKK